MEKTRSTNLIILAFLIALLIFLTGFLISNSIIFYKSDLISTNEDVILYNLISSDIQYSLFEKSFNCSDNVINKLPSKQLDDVGKTLALLEERLGKNDDRIISAKKLYSALEIKHMLFVEKINEECKKDIPIVLFFYSNQKDNLVNAEAWGRYLTNMKSDSNIMIYSLDYDLDYEPINYLKSDYAVNSPNTVVLDGEIFNQIDEMNNFLQHNNP